MTPPPVEAALDGRRTSHAVRRALTWYLVGSVVVLVLVSIGVLLVSRTVVRNEVLRDSQRTARAVADSIVGPLVTEDFLRGDPAAVGALDWAMALRLRDGSLLHVKVWQDAGDGAGRILYADEPVLVGRTFSLEADEYAVFGTSDTVATISDLQKPENELERSEGELVEVYSGVIADSGLPVLFEAYIPTDRLAEDSASLAGDLLPLTLGALLLLTLCTLPLAVSLARRVDRAQRERARLLAHAVESSDLERRRIASDLHDGVVQDLAGVGYSLSSLARQSGQVTTQQQVDELAAIVRRDVAQLRTLMTDIYPPDLDHRGLAEAVRDLLAQGPFAEIAATCEVDEPLTCSPVTGRLAFRVVREALRNVAAHASAAHVAVRIGQREGTLTFEVTDDGIGFDPGDEAQPGHVGLRLVRETVEDAGGSWAVESSPGWGTRVFGALPL